MKHIFIINPSAGKNDSRQRIYAMAEALREKHGLDVRCMLTASVGHAATLARGLAESGEEVRLYACGGDGTVNEVANGIAGYANAAMTCIPIGTGNDFLKNFGADYEKFLDAENLWNGVTQALDLIDCSGRYCLTIACSGIDARIAELKASGLGADVVSHPISRPDYLEAEAVSRLLRIAQAADAPVIIVHTTNRASLDEIAAARRRGKQRPQIRAAAPSAPRAPAFRQSNGAEAGPPRARGRRGSAQAPSRTQARAAQRLGTPPCGAARS